MVYCFVFWGRAVWFFVLFGACFVFMLLRLLRLFFIFALLLPALFSVLWCCAMCYAGRWDVGSLFVLLLPVSYMFIVVMALVMSWCVPGRGGGVSGLKDGKSIA